MHTPYASSTRPSVTVLLMLAAFALAACSSDSNNIVGGNDTGGGLADAGAADMGGGEADTGGGAADAGATADTAGTADAGGEADVDNAADTGGETDTGGADDAGGEMDAGAQADSGPAEVSFSDVYAAIFQTNGCVGCHANKFATESMAFETLAKGSYCQQDYVVPGSLEQSAIHAKLVAGVPLSCGQKMPKNSSGISSEQAELLEQWILDGAKP